MDLSVMFKLLPPGMMEQMQGFLDFVRHQATLVVNKQAEIDARLYDMQAQLDRQYELLHRIDEYISGGIPAAPTDYTVPPIPMLPPMENEEQHAKRSEHERADFAGSPPGYGGSYSRTL